MFFILSNICNFQCFKGNPEMSGLLIYSIFYAFLYQTSVYILCHILSQLISHISIQYSLSLQHTRSHFGAFFFSVACNSIFFFNSSIYVHIKVAISISLLPQFRCCHKFTGIPCAIFLDCYILYTYLLTK